MRTSISTVEYLAVTAFVLMIVYYARSLRSIDGKRRIPPINIIFAGALIFSVYSYAIGINLFIFSDRHRYANAVIRTMYFGFDEIFFSGSEPSVFLLYKLFGSFPNSANWLYFTVTFVFFIINLIVIAKLSDNYKASVLFFMLSQLPFHQLEILKQVLAYSFGNIAFLFYIREKKALGLVFIVIACTFHVTAVILLLYFLAFNFAGAKKTNRILLIMSVIVVSIVMYSAINFAAMRFGVVRQYLQFNSITAGVGADTNRRGLATGLVSALFHGLPYYFLLIVSLIQYKRLVASNVKNKIYICALLYSSFLFTQGYVFFALTRLGMFMIVPAVAWAPTLLASIKDKWTRFTIGFIFAALLLVVTVWHVAWKVDDYSIVRFQTISR